MKTWMITGSSSGFGKTLAETVLKSGDRVAATARKPEALADLVNRFGEQIIPIEMDVTAPPSIARAVDEAWEHFGRVDILVNNAGYGLLAALEETDEERLRKNLETNLVGPLYVIKAAIPRLRAQNGGHIINMSAIAASVNELGFSVYGAVKAGLEAASDALAGELAPFGVKVTIVIPGPFRTDFIGRSLDSVPRLPGYEKTVGHFAGFLEKINGRQPGDPQKAAAAIASIAGIENPPGRLLLGAYAHEKFFKKLDALRAEAERFRGIGLATDFPPGS